MRPLPPSTRSRTCSCRASRSSVVVSPERRRAVLNDRSRDDPNSRRGASDSTLGNRRSTSRHSCVMVAPHARRARVLSLRRVVVVVVLPSCWRGVSGWLVVRWSLGGARFRCSWRTQRAVETEKRRPTRTSRRPHLESCCPTTARRTTTSRAHRHRTVT